MIEVVLMRAFVMLYHSRDYETGDYLHGTDESAGSDDAGRPYWYMTAKFRRAEHPSFTLLSSVCWNWHQTLIGWLESPTSAKLTKYSLVMTPTPCRVAGGIIPCTYLLTYTE